MLNNMNVKEIKKGYGVVSNSDNEIEALKTPENTVYPAKDSLVFECETEKELNEFILNKKLEYPKNN